MRFYHVTLAACLLAFPATVLAASVGCPDLNGDFQCPGAYGDSLRFQTARNGSKVVYQTSEKTVASNGWTETVELTVDKSRGNVLGSLRATCKDGALRMEAKTGILFNALFDANVHTTNIYSLDADGNLVRSTATWSAGDGESDAKQAPAQTCHRYSN